MNASPRLLVVPALLATALAISGFAAGNGSGERLPRAAREALEEATDYVNLMSDQCAVIEPALASLTPSEQPASPRAASWIELTEARPADGGPLLSTQYGAPQQFDRRGNRYVVCLKWRDRFFAPPHFAADGQHAMTAIETTDGWRLFLMSRAAGDWQVQEWRPMSYHPVTFPGDGGQ